MSQLIYKSLNQDEATMFYLLCAKARSTGIPENDIHLEELIEKGWNVKSARFQNRIHAIMQTLMEIKTCEHVQYLGVKYNNFFTSYSFNGTDLLYALNEDAMAAAAEVADNLSLRLSVGTGELKGKYARRLFFMLNANRRAGMLRLSIEDLYKELQIAESYPLKETSRSILKPAVRKINDAGLFSELDYRYIRRQGKAESVIFEWEDLLK